MSQLIDLSDYADQDLLSQLRGLVCPYVVQDSPVIDHPDVEAEQYSADFLVVRNIRDGILIAYRVLSWDWEVVAEVARAEHLGDIGNLDWCPLDSYVKFSSPPYEPTRSELEYQKVRKRWVYDVNEAVRALMTEKEISARSSYYKLFHQPPPLYRGGKHD